MVVFAILSCLFLAALWSPAGKGLVFLWSFCRHFPIQCPGSGVVLDCMDSRFLPSSLLNDLRIDLYTVLINSAM